jgi:hypothetical protein
MLRVIYKCILAQNILVETRFYLGFKTNDYIKSKWCEKKRINLIGISYKDKWKILDDLKEKLGLN